MENIDHYKYPGEDVLINEFDCHDAEDLAKLEALSTGGNLAYLQLHPIKGKFDFRHILLKCYTIVKMDKGIFSRYFSRFSRCTFAILQEKGADKWDKVIRQMF